MEMGHRSHPCNHTKWGIVLTEGEETIKEGDQGGISYIFIQSKWLDNPGSSRL